MLNLSEEWKKAYATYLEEDYNRIDNDVEKIFAELDEAQTQCKKSFDVLKEYYNIYALSEGIVTEEVGHTNPKGEVGDEVTVGPGATGTVNNGKARERVDNPNDKNDKIVRQTVQQTLASLISDFGGMNPKIAEYQPEVTYTVQNIRDMKFPSNVLFFLKQLITWVKNVVIYFIEKIMNILRRITGRPEFVLDSSKLKLDLSYAKKIEQISTSMAYGKGPIQARVVNNKDGETFAQYAPILGEAGPANYNFIDDIADASGVIKGFKEPNIKTEKIVVTLDLSKDLMTLKQLVQHFYDLFDNSYGSNNEKLFEADDLEVILQVFKATIERTKSGDLTRTYTLGGSATEVEAISDDRVRDNVILTSQNITQLKAAYMQTSAKIKDISRIINSKEMLMLSDLGADYRFLSSATYSQMSMILDTVSRRMKQASKLEKDLQKMQKNYQKVNDQLASMQRYISGLSNVTYDSVYNRTIIKLINSAKGMSDIITLRLSGIGLYIQELKSVRDCLNMLAGINKNTK